MELKSLILGIFSKKGKKMKSNRCFIVRSLLISLLFFLIQAGAVSTVFAYPEKFTDSSNIKITIRNKPVRVVSLVPGVTEIIFSLGAGNVLKGITYHSVYPCEASKKKIVGGFLSPSVQRIKEINPDVIFYSKLQKKVIEEFSTGKYLMINLETKSLAESYKNIILLGRIFDKNKKAVERVKRIKKDLGIIDKKISKICKKKRKRVIRLMGRTALMAPGDDSFQNEMIKAAGGIPPEFGKKGNIVAVTEKEWIKFNPQVIYGCGRDSKTAKKFFDSPELKDVDAVKNGKIFYFPCALTCRASTNTGYFVSWLASKIYTDEFACKKNQVLKEKIFKTKSLDINLEYIKDSRIAYSRIHDFINKTLIIDFKIPMEVVSSLEGYRKKIISVGNHYSPPSCWGIGHKHGLKKIRSRIYKVIGANKADTSFLFTGANMDNLSIHKQAFKDMTVYALVTAGVRSNAVRMSKDSGNYYEPGTINIIILTNMNLTKRAMTRAVISVTEAKTAALLDMDIRSSVMPAKYRATGTGTDNIIVVKGTGVSIDNTGGHSKIGELIAGAVYAGVKEAVCKQNAIVDVRNIFQRLNERKISAHSLISEIGCDCKIDKGELGIMVEQILLDPVYAGFLESAFVLSDDYEKRLIKNLASYNLWCRETAWQIAGKKFENMKDFVESEDIPIVLKNALNAILNGAYYRTLK